MGSSVTLASQLETTHMLDEKEEAPFQDSLGLGREGDHLSLSKKKCSLTLELFSPEHSGLGAGLRGCSKGEGHTALKWQKDELLASKTLKRMEVEEESCPHSVLTWLPEQDRTTSGYPFPRLDEKGPKTLTAQAGSGHGNRTRDWHGSLPWARRGLEAAGTPICCVPSLAASQEGKGTVMT